MRRLLISGLIALAVIGALGSSLGWWAQRELVSAGGFTSQTRALEGRSELRASITDALVRAVSSSRPELRVARPQIRAAVVAALARRQLPVAMADGYACLHRQVASAASPLRLDVRGALPLVADELRAQGHPELAVLSPRGTTPVSIAVAHRSQHPLLWTALEWASTQWWLLPIVTALGLGGAIFVSFRPLDTAAVGAAAIGGGSGLMALVVAGAPGRTQGAGRVVAQQFAPSLVAQAVGLALVSIAAAGACVLVALRASRRQTRTMTEIRIADVRRVLAREPLPVPALPSAPEPVALPPGPVMVRTEPLDTTEPADTELGRALAELMQGVEPTPQLAQRPDRPPGADADDGDPEDDGNPPDPWTSTFLPTRGATDST